MTDRIVRAIAGLVVKKMAHRTGLEQRNAASFWGSRNLLWQNLPNEKHPLAHLGVAWDGSDSLYVGSNPETIADKFQR